MPNWFRRLALLTIALVTLPSAAIVGAGVRGMLSPPEVPLVLYLAPPELVKDQVFRVPKATLDVIFKTFTSQRSFAAFAADAQGHWGYAGGKHSAAAARAQALARCLGACAVMFELRPAGYSADRPGQSVSARASLGIAETFFGRQMPWRGYYAVAEDGSWSIERPGDGTVLPQWAVLNRCRAALEPRRAGWPDSLPYPQCRLYQGTVTIIDKTGREIGIVPQLSASL